MRGSGSCCALFVTAWAMLICQESERLCAADGCVDIDMLSHTVRRFGVPRCPVPAPQPVLLRSAQAASWVRGNLHGMVRCAVLCYGVRTHLSLKQLAASLPDECCYQHKRQVPSITQACCHQHVTLEASWGPNHHQQHQAQQQPSSNAAGTTTAARLDYVTKIKPNCSTSCSV